MDKRIAALLGAAAALTTVIAANAEAPIQSELTPATSYQDLLAPVPNAVAALKADDAQRVEADTGVQLAQYHHHHHHHHHHHRHHHHHHHYY